MDMVLHISGESRAYDMTKRRRGILRLFRTDGATVRALLVVLALQILIPLFGVLPTQAAPIPGAITVCTVHGMVTLIPDGEGGWEEQKAEQAGISCSFCLPLLAAAATPSVAPGVPLPVAVTITPPRRTALRAPVALHILSARPRAPPTLV